MDIFVFDGKKYNLIKNIIFNNKEYLYYVCSDDYKIYIICEKKNDNIVVVEDKKMLGKLVLELYKTNNYKE
jgi:Fe2+ or Zn2+ uptake regulation protein